MRGCADCEESRVLCRECGGPVCPVHRMGTGALSEGYHCSMACSLMSAGIVRRPDPPFIRTHWPLVALVVFVVGWAAVQLVLLRV